MMKNKGELMVEGSFGPPEKKKTLVEKQEERIRKLNLLRVRIFKTSPRWVKVGEAIGLFCLLALNFFLLSPFFGQADQTNFFSAPSIPILVNLISFWVPYSYGVRIWLLAFMIFFPLSFYFFAKALSGRKLVGFLSSFIVSLPVGIFLPARVNLGLWGSDGAHIASYTFIPLVCLLLLKFLRSGKFETAIFAALGITSIAITSPLGLVVLLTFATILTFSEVLLGQGRLKLARHLIVLTLALGFSAFWYNPKFLLLVWNSQTGQFLRQTFANLLPISFFIVPLLGVFGFLLFENRANLQSLFIASFLTFSFLLLSLGSGFSWITSVRFKPALGISLALFLGITITWFLDFLKISERAFSNRFTSLKVLAKYRKSLANSFFALVALFIISSIFLFGENFRQAENSQVLGVFFQDRGVGLWEIRETTSPPEAFLGYAISILTGVGMVFLKRNLIRISH